MIRIVILAVLLTAAVTIPLTAAWTRRPRQTRRERLLDEAIGLLFQLRNPSHLDRIEVLSDWSKKEADRLIDNYNKEISK